MRIRIGMVLILMGTFGTAMAHEQSTTPNPFLRLVGNGQWWTSIPSETKENFVDGYTTAMERVNHVSQSLCKQNVNDAKPGDPHFDAKFQGAMNLCLVAETFDFALDAKKLQSGVDDFYADSANTRITITLAMQYVRDRLKGKRSAYELDQELSEWRKIVNR